MYILRASAGDGGGLTDHQKGDGTHHVHVALVCALVESGTNQGDSHGVDGQNITLVVRTYIC